MEVIPLLISFVALLLLFGWLGHALERQRQREAVRRFMRSSVPLMDDLAEAIGTQLIPAVGSAIAAFESFAHAIAGMEIDLASMGERTTNDLA